MESNKPPYLEEVKKTEAIDNLLETLSLNTKEQQIHNNSFNQMDSMEGRTHTIRTDSYRSHTISSISST